MKKIFALILALVMVASLAACGGNTEPTTPATTEATTPATTEATTEATTPATTEPAVQVMTYAEFVAAELDTPVVVEAYVQATQGWYQDAIIAYTQNEDGAFYVYKFTCTEEEAAKLVPGTKVRITGFKGAYKGMVEIVDATFEILEGTWTATPLDVTALLGTDEMINHLCELVVFKGMTIKKVEYKNGEPGDDIYLTVAKDDKEYSLSVEVYLTGTDTEVYKAVGELKEGDVVDITGFLYWYDGMDAHVTAVTPAN